MDPASRMIDANANRAREALRVMEDVARFGLDHEDLCRRIKGLRHDLASALRASDADPLRLVASRDTPGDVGTAVTGSGEGARAGLRDIAAAACKRLTEALRVVEEAVKTCPWQGPPAPESSQGRPAPLPVPAPVPVSTPPTPAWELIESLRYRAYDVERDLLLALGTGRGVQWRLCVLVTESLCKRPWEEVVAGALEGGADCIQLREKTLDGGELLRRAKWLVEMCHARSPKAAAIINDRPDIALLAGAHGVHVGQGDLPVSAVRELAGSRLLVGVSTHDLNEARAAAAAGADYCGVGAMFATTTKARETSGADYLLAYLADPALARIPHLAIGGITPANAGDLFASGCRGIAVSGCVCGADDPAGVCGKLRSELS